MCVNVFLHYKQVKCIWLVTRFSMMLQFLRQKIMCFGAYLQTKERPGVIQALVHIPHQ